MADNEPVDVKGVLVENDPRRGYFHITIEPGAVVQRIHYINGLGGYAGRMTFISPSRISDLRPTYRGTIPIEPPADVGDNVRLIRSHEVTTVEDDLSYRKERHVVTIVDNLSNRNREARVRELDTVWTGDLYFRRVVLGTLERISGFEVKLEYGRCRDSYTPLMIRSTNGRAVTRVSFYGNDSLEDAVDHEVQLTEEIWRHKMGSWLLADELGQKLVDLRTGKGYSGGIELKMVSSGRLRRWRAQAKKLQDVPYDMAFGLR